MIGLGFAGDLTQEPKSGPLRDWGGFLLNCQPILGFQHCIGGWPERIELTI